MAPTESYRDPHCVVDFQRHCVWVDNRTLTLTRKEFELFAMLVSNASEIVPREVLLQSIWGYSREIRTRTLDVHIRRLRKKLGVYGDQYIETIFGVGYRFQPYREPRSFSVYQNILAAAV